MFREEHARFGGFLPFLRGTRVSGIMDNMHKNRRQNIDIIAVLTAIGISDNI